MAAPSGPSARYGARVGSFNRSFISSTQRDGAPQFSPDGKRIAFVSERSGHTEIWVCNGDGSSPVELTSFTVRLSQLRAGLPAADELPLTPMQRGSTTSG